MNHDLSRSKGKIRADFSGNNRTASFSQTTAHKGLDAGLGKTMHDEDRDRFERSKPLREFEGSTSRFYKLEQPNFIEPTSIHEPRWFWNKHFYWSHFERGLFWGTLVSFTAILSAGCGVVLTKVDRVENAIAQIIPPSSFSKQAAKQSTLTSPLNVLLIEIDRSNKVKIQNILVLKFDPRIGFAKVINIPTDSRVKLPGGAWGTVADAYQDGGIKLTSRSIERLMNDVKLDRYFQAESSTFEYLAARIKLTLTHCEQVIQDCSSTSEQIQRQEDEFEAIRQRLRIQAYFTNFEQTVEKIQPNLNSDLSVQEFVSIANFVKGLKGNNISINFLPGYTSSEAISSDRRLNKPQSKL